MKTQTITRIGLAAMVAATLTVTSCKKKGCTDSTATNYNEKAKKDDGSCLFEEVKTDNNVIEGSITSNTTWDSDKIYELKGKVVVESGVTLTIKPGAIIKGQEGSGTNASALIIAKGAKLNAVGSAVSPIIFTSVLDDIELGQTSGSNLDETDAGKWGGVIILGKAPISAGDGDTQSQIEGIPATSAYGAFGGTDPLDNSGTLDYISIRHGGALIGAGNEINGLTLGGVGSGTTISNIEIVSNLDDGIEFFGGTVNVTNVLVSYQGDDGLDIDMNYAGTVNNFVVVYNGATGDEGLEIDGPEGSTNTSGLFTLKNGLVRSKDNQSTGVDFKSKAQGTLDNITWEGYTSKVLKFRASFSDTTNCTGKADAYAYLTDVTPTLKVNNCKIVGSQTIASAVDVYTKSFINSANDNCTSSMESVAESTVTNAGTSVVASASTGIILAPFSWTWTSSKGKL